MPEVMNENWSFLATFSSDNVDLDAERHWTDTSPWVSTAHGVLTEQIGLLEQQVQCWNGRLKALGGDPSVRDWSNFRPLRLSREEDWSDWLAHLLQTSTTGALARALFYGAVDCNFSAPAVSREERTDDASRRLDLLIKWAGGTHVTHVEVKIWDGAFEKTFEASSKARAAYGGGTSWTNFLLLPVQSLSTWSDVREKHNLSGEERVVEVTWTSLASALRRCLLDGNEDLAWQVWAYSFCGAIEHHILGHIQLGAVQTDLTDLPVLVSQVEFMREACGDE